MNSIQEKLIAKIGELLETDNFDECLADIKTLVMSARSDQLVEVIDSVQMSDLLQKLYENVDKVDIDQVISVLDLVLNSLPSDYIISRFHSQILEGLSSKNSNVIEMWLKTLDRCFADEVVCRNLINSNVSLNPILNQVSSLMDHDSSTIAKFCHNILFNTAKNPSLSSEFYNERLQKFFTDIKKSNEIVRLRVDQLMVDIACVSTSSFERVSWHLTDFLNYFKENLLTDPLIALNCSQIVADLCSSNTGVEFVESSGLLALVEDKINNCENEPFGNMVVPGFFKIFSTIASRKPDVLNNYPSVLGKLFSLLHAKDQTLLCIAVDTVGLIGKSNEGKRILNSKPEMTRCIKTLGSLLHNSATEVKLRSLTCLSNLFQSFEADPNGEITMLIESWNSRLIPGRKTASKIISICRQPFMEIRIAALELVRVLCTHVWGQKELASLPGFVKYILDRSTEFEKEGKEAKFKVVSELVNSPFLSISFSREAIHDLRKYHRNGPFYVDRESAVAFEGES